MTCSQCDTPVKNYRQCPEKSCGMEVGFCSEHGGDAEAIEQMIDHIRKHRESGQ